MARCPLCESDVPDGRSACDVCGQPFDRGLTTRAALDVTKRAIAAARKDLVPSGRDAADPSFARSLLERAEQTEAAGDLGRALDLARASRRVLEIARRKARVSDALTYADAVLEGAKQAGIETLAFQRNIDQARALAGRRDFVAAERLLRRISIRTLDQRRERVLQGIVEKAQTRVRYAEERGGNVEEAERHLVEARNALALREYHRIRPLASKAIEKADAQRKYARAETTLDRAAAEIALVAKEYGRVRGLAKDAHDAVREASLLQTVRNAFASLQVDAEDLRNLGADAADFEQILVDLTKAVEAKDLAAARRLVGRARHSAESARDSHFRTIMEQSLQIILMNAARGLDPAVARQLLKEVDDAVSLGKRLDMQALIDKRMAEADTETESKLNVRVLQARDDIVALRQGGQNDTMGLEGKLADAAIGIQERRFFHADALLDSVEHDIFATRELMRSSAAEVLGQARGEVARAKADGIHVDAAAQMLRDAETSYSEARYGDTIYAGKACISEVEELAHAAADTKRKSEAEVVRSKLERTEGIHRRMESVRVEIQDLLAHNVDLAHALETLAAAEQAVERGSLEEAEHLVASAEGIVKGVKVTLNHQAKGALERARKAVEQASRDGVEAPEFAALLANAQAAVQTARPAEVLQATGEIDRLLSERRQIRHQDEQRRTLEKARSAATKFITVKKLIMDLRKADIDITGAEESLRAADQAIEERNFDDVDAILTDLDSTAKELMDELLA